MYKVEWDDHEGNHHEMMLERQGDAEMEAAYLDEKYDGVSVAEI